MKSAKYFLFLLGALLFVGKTTQAQDYKPDYQFAAGLKFGGYENGISGKYFMNPTTSLEGDIGIRSNHGLVVTGLYELNQKAFNIDGFKFYYGFGAHIGAVGAGYYHRFNGDNELYTSSQ